ncbi:MAG: hypothetical protein LBO06_04920 [Bacteroidales bacterium]|jgi:predicted histone-like DNA-binding protein|nr:hypothetical protein [Bacteroidales bacterium]
MSFKYVEVQRNSHVGSNPGTRYWAKIFRSGTVTADTIVRNIAQNTQVSEAVVFSVLKGLEMQLGQQLEAGAAVRLPFVGMFIPTFDADAKTTLAQVDASTIHRYRYRFFPSLYLKDIAKKTKAEKAPIDITGLQNYSEALTEEQYDQLVKANQQPDETDD